MKLSTAIIIYHIKRLFQKLNFLRKRKAITGVQETETILANIKKSLQIPELFLSERDHPNQHLYSLYFPPRKGHTDVIDIVALRTELARLHQVPESLLFPKEKEK